MYIRRIATTYFVPLQLGVVAALLWANIDEDSYIYLWGTDTERTLDLGFSIADHHVGNTLCGFPLAPYIR